MKMDSRILIVDDDRELLESAEFLLSSLYTVRTANSVEKAKSILLQNEFDVVVVDLNFEGQEEDGIALLDFIDKHETEVEVVVLSGDRVTARIVEAMKRNLIDFIPKSGEYGTALKLAIDRGFEKKKQRLQKDNECTFLTNSPKMKALLRTARKVAANSGQFPILITGESGTGKEVFVQYLASLLGKHMTAANMASIPRDTAESELFGHARGAFTGAIANKPGLIEQAHNGIFFLDELGECSLAIQAKLLRVIQEKEIQSVGNVKTKRIDVRFFAATNKDLDAMIQQGTFRLDLLQRLNTVHLRLPSLRERPEDIVLYANSFLSEFSDEKAFTLTSCGIEALLEYPWPGNVRELRNTIERLVIFNDKRTIDGATVKTTLHSATAKHTMNASLNQDTMYSRSEILAILEQENGNRTRTAARLGVHTVTIQRWLKKFGIESAFSSSPGRPSSLRKSPIKAEA